MVGMTDADLAGAEARGQEALDKVPRAASARYDREAGRVMVELLDGCAYAFPAQLVQDLQGAGADELAGVEVDGMGFNLH